MVHLNKILKKLNQNDLLLKYFKISILKLKSTLG